MKQNASAVLMHETECSRLVPWDDPEECDGKGGSGWGTHVHPWRIHVNVWQKPIQYCKEKKKTGTGEPGGLPSLGSHRVGHD